MHSYDEITYLKQKLMINGLGGVTQSHRLGQILSQMNIFHCGTVKLLRVELLVARNIDWTYIPIGNQFLLAS